MSESPSPSSLSCLRANYENITLTRPQGPYTPEDFAFLTADYLLDEDFLGSDALHGSNEEEEYTSEE